MELLEFREAVREAQEKKQFFTAFINCAITYSGRAEAFLPRGDRLLVLKQDGVLLLHQPENGNPINYLKAGCTFTMERDNDLLPDLKVGASSWGGGRPETIRPKGRGIVSANDKLWLHAKSGDGKEFLDVEIFDVHDIMTRRLDDGQKQELQGTEKDMSDMIKARPELISADFKPLSREEHTKVGFIDVFGHDGDGNLVIVETKRYSASLACVTQLFRYVEKMKELRGTDKVKGVMAAPGVTPNALELLKQWGFSWARVEAPKRLERHNRGQKRLGEY